MAWGIADERGDIYSLGVTLYRALTGIHPFPLTSPEELSASRQFAYVLTNGRKSIMPPSRMLLGRPTGLDEVIMKCLEFDMFSRFRNGSELLAAMSDL
jgi:serine/threonine protein kinase